jgi:hypothetical protein
MPSQFCTEVQLGACRVGTKAMEDRAARYRSIAAEVRAKADTMSDEHARRDMLMAAQVWDRLAAFAEKSVPRPLQVYTRQPNT